MLQFKGRRRTVMAPGRYTELFFLDEAVSLAAGHRPCAECRRDRYNAFKEAWVRARLTDSKTKPAALGVSADEMDWELHRARAGRERVRGRVDSLPDGCFVLIDGSSWLVWGDALLRWSHEGYVERRRRTDHDVEILTPEPIVRCLRNGYVPEIHGSAW